MPVDLKPIDAFFTKISNLLIWQQDILRRIMVSGKGYVLNSQLSEIILMVKKFYNIPLPEGAVAVEPIALQRELLQEDLLETDDVTIYKISDIQNVNALSNKGIVFTDKAGPGLTVVYGRNGSGKTGYIRILKKISAVRVGETERIFKNCMTNDSRLPQATIHIGDQKYTWNEQTIGCKYARKIRIFDTKNATIYINGESNQKTEMVYTPSLFKLFDELVEVISVIKTKLSDEKNGVVGSHEAVVKKFADQNIKDLRIDRNTPDAEIESLIAWDDEKSKEWQRIKDTVEGREALLKQKRLLKSLLEAQKDNIKTIEELLAVQNIKNLFEKTVEQKTLKDSLTKLKEVTEQNNPLPGVCTEKWDVLWKAAIDFIGGNFATQSSVCPLCMQHVGAEARDRINKFQNWIGNDIKQKLDAVENFLKNKRDIFYRIDSLWGAIENISKSLDEGTDIRVKLDCFVSNGKDNFKVLKEKIASGLFVEQEFKPVDIYKEIFGDIEAGEFDSFEKKLENEILRLEAPISKEEYDEYSALKKNFICFTEKDLLRDLKKNDQILENFGLAINGCGTDIITRSKTALCKTFLSDNFNQIVEQERSFFGLPHLIKFNISGQQGKSMQTLVSDNPGALPPASFMSEGEAKIATLSCFIAEYKMSGAKIPLVFDDPITSLDHNFQSRVVKRLVELAKETQVIVFTHNAVFLNELQVVAAENDLEPNIKFLKLEKGVSGIEHGGEWENKKVEDKINYIRAELNKLSDDEYDQIKDLGGCIREIWEQSIEDVLFQGAITRFCKDIQTTRLEYVRIDDTIYPLINAGMTKTSRWANHSQARAVSERVTRQEVVEALREVEDFIKSLKGEITKRKVEREKTRKNRVI